MGLNVYDNNSTATIKTGAKINQGLDLQAASSTQTVTLSADTTQQFVTLAGIMHLRVNFKELGRFKAEPKDGNNAISFFGNKSGSFGFGGSTMLQFLDNTTAAVVEEGVSIHTDTSGSGLTVEANETVHSTQIAQSGSDSDKGAVAASAVYAGHESTTVAQVDAGAIIDGGALNITSSSDVITEAVTGGFSWGPIGIGMSGGVVNVNRHTGAFTGRRKWSDEYADELPYGSAAGVDLPAALGTLTVAGLAVTAANNGVTGNFSIVGAGAVGRESSNPIVEEFKEEEDINEQIDKDRNALQGSSKIGDGDLPIDDDKSAFAFAGDAAVNLVSDIADAQIDVAGFSEVTIGSDGGGDLEVTATDDTLHWAFSGAGAYAGASEGTAVAFAGSFAVNSLDVYTEAHLRDTSTPERDSLVPVNVSGDVLVTAEAAQSTVAEDAFGVWAISGSLGVSSADDKHWSTAAALNMSINLVTTETTRASIGNVGLTAAAGSITIDAQNHRSMNADGGAFDVSLKKAKELRPEPGAAGAAGGSVAVGGSNSINKIENLTVDALVDNNTAITSESLTVNAYANPNIRAVTVSGSVSAANAEVSINGSESGSVNEINRKVMARIGDEDRQTGLRGSAGTLAVSGDVKVVAKDESTILAVSGGIAFSLDTSPKGTFTGLAGFAWSHNWLDEECQVLAKIVGFTVGSDVATPGTVDVKASSAPSIKTYVIQLGVLASRGGVVDANITGAISKNQIDGSDSGNVTAGIQNSVVDALDSVNVCADDESAIHATIWAAGLTVSADLFELHVGINYGENEYGSKLAAEIVNSTVTAAGGDVSVQAVSNPDLFTEVGNANVDIQFLDSENKLKETPVSISVSDIGTFATNTVSNTVASSIDNSSVGAGGSLVVRADDKAAIESKSFGNQVGFSLSLTGGKDLSLDVGAITQFATNEVSTDLSALITNSPANPIGGSAITADGALSVTATKQQSVQAHMETTSVGVGISTTGMAINLSAATSVVHNSVGIDEHSRTYASIDNTFLEAAAVTVSAEARPSLYTKIWDVDVQVAGGATAAVAALYGESKAVNTLKEDVQATIKKGSKVTASSGSIKVLANLLPTDLPDPDPNYSRYSPPPQTNIYADTHSVGVSMAIAVPEEGVPIAFAGAVILSDTVSTSQSKVIAKVEDSDLDAYTDISVSSNDNTTVYAVARDTSVAISDALSVAVAVPKAEQTIGNTVQATVESTSDGESEMDIIAQNGDIDVTATSGAHVKTETTVWSASIGAVSVSDSSSTTTSKISDEASLEAAVIGNGGANRLHLQAPQGSANVRSRFDGHSESSIHSGAVSASIGGSVDTVISSSVTSPTVFAFIEGVTTVEAFENVVVQADAEGHAQNESKQTSVGVVFAGSGLNQNSTADPEVSAWIGDPLSAYDNQAQWRPSFETTVEGDEGITLRAQSFIDAATESQMIGGSIGITVLSPESHATVSPTVKVEVGPGTHLKSLNAIEIEAFGGLDQSPRPSTFDASRIDDDENTIEYADLHRLQTGNVVKYLTGVDENEVNNDLVSGLESGKEYQVIVVNDKLVQLGSQIESSQASVDVDTDQLRFNSRVNFQQQFTPVSDLTGTADTWERVVTQDNLNSNWQSIVQSWDKVIYQPVSPAPEDAIEGLKPDATSYRVNRVADDAIMLWEADVDLPVPWVITDETVQADGSFQFTDHKFEDGQHVTYRAADPISFSSGLVNQTVTLSTDNGDPDLSGDPESDPSNTIYLGNGVNRFYDDNGFIDDMIVEYRVEAAPNTWYWTEGPTPAPESDDTTEPADAFHSLTGTQFWAGGSSSQGGSVVGNAYVNWAVDTPSLTSVDNHYATIDNSGLWRDDAGTALQSNQYVIEYPQFVLFPNEDGMSQQAAKIFAKGKGGWLPSITSQEEWQQAKTAAADNTVWLGGSDDAREDTWVWDGGGQDPEHGKQFWDGGKNGSSTLSPAPPWQDGEPNDGGSFTAVRNRETGLEMLSGGYWNDEDKDTHHTAILVEFPRYKIITTLRDGKTSFNFPEAHEDAQNRKGWIATIGSQDDNDLITGLMTDNTEPAWIGASNDQIIGGLEDGGRYKVGLAANTTNHPQSIQLYPLTGDTSTVIAIDNSGLASSVNHTFVSIRELPLTRLGSGRTYYVNKIDADSFHLAETVGGSNIMVSGKDTDPDTNDVTKTGQFGFIGTMGVDLTGVGQGLQNLVFDIDDANGTQTLKYVKGLQAKPDGTGTASSYVHAAGGTLIAQSVRPRSTSTASPDVAIVLSSGSRVQAARDIDITALSAGNANTSTEAYGGAIVSGAGAHATSMVDHKAKVQLYGNLHANEHLTVESKISDAVEAHADTKSYGALDANALSHTRIAQSFTSLIDVDQGARLSAGDSIELNAYTFLDDLMTSNTHSGALFGTSKANQDDTSGIHIESSGENKNTTEINISRAHLLADEIYLNSRVLGIDTAPDDTDGDVVVAFGGGMQNANQATATVNVNETTSVKINNNAKLVGDRVEITATQQDLNLHTRSHTRRGRAASKSEAEINYTGTSQITSSAGATVVTENLVVQAGQLIDDGDISAVTDSDRGDFEPTYDPNSNREIDWNATVLGRRQATLDVDADGTIVAAEGLVVQPYEYVASSAAFPNGFTFAQAQTHAESLGGRLVTIRSAAEQQLLEEFIATQPGTDDFWIGASDEGHEGTWKWLEDEQQDVTFWTQTGDELFWTGGASGHAVDNGYSNWGTRYQVIDQSQSLATDGGFGGHLAQSFQPGTNNITGASVRTSPYNSNDVPADITIGLYDQLPGFGGNLLATGTALNVRAGEWAVVDFGGQVSVIPNTTYYLDILSSELAFTHYYGTEEDSYPRGEMFTQNGTVFDHDLAFRTFTEVDIAGPAGDGNDYAALRMSTDDRGNLNSDWITAHADEQRYYVLKTIDDNGSQTLELRKNSARESGTWTWQEALADAASHSPAGTIADVQSAADEERLRELFHEEFCEGQNNPREKCLPDHEYVGLWINASDEVTEGEWTRPVNAFEKWNSGEPNNFEGNENAAQYQVSNHTWNDLDGTQELPFIVEYDQITIESVSFDDPQPSDSIAGQSYDFKISAIAALDVTFTTDTATVKGTPLFYAHAHVDLENHSSRDLVVGDVDLVSFPYSPNVSVISANDNLNYTTTLPAGETLGGQFYARNLWSDPSTATPLLQISGTINNPSGIVELKNLSGDITGGGGTSRGVIEGHEIFIDAPDGAVDSGDSDETFLIRLHDARLLSPNLSVIAGEQLTLDVQAEPDETGRARGVDRLEGSVVDIGLLAWNDYSILQDAPVGYWDLNEKTGTVARDASHSGVNGTYANVTLGVDGPIKQQPDTAVSFSGTGSVTIPDSSSLYGNQAQTVTGWFKVDRLSSDFQPVYFKGNEGTGTTDYTDSGTNRENTFWVTPTGQLHFSVTFTDSSAQEALTTAEDPVEADTWYHFATVADLVQGKMSVYLNGELLLTHDTGTDHSIQDTPGAWWLGQSPSGSELYGALDDFAIFNTVLSEDQIARQYDAGIADGPYPVDTHYVIDGFVADLQLDALHREIRSAGNLTITGRDADGTPLAGAVPTDSLPTVQIQAHVEIADLTTGQLTVTTNGDIHLSEGVDYIREKIDGTFSYAQAFTDAGTNGRWLTTISDSDEQRIVRTVAEGEAVWFGANDVRLEGDWNWVAGEVLTTPFYLGDYRTGNLLTEGSELTEHSEIREALADVYTNWAVDPQGFQTQPVNSYSNENFAVMRSDGFWDDVAPVWDAPSVQSEQVSWLDAVRQFAPVGFWRLGEAAGEITAVDLNNTINGTYSGVTLGVAGAISYDGNTAAGFGDAASNSHVSIPDNIRLHGDQAQTVTGWFQVDDLDETWQAVYFKGDPGNNPTDYINSGQNRENTFWVNSSGYLYMAMSLKDGSTELTLATEAGLIQPGQWHHFATVIDAEHGELKTYLDGKSVAQLEIQPGDSIRDTGGDWLLGNSPSGMSSLHGLLDEFAIYNTVLTADQIERQYSAGISSGDSEVLFWQGNSTGSAVDGAYTNWNTGEPNNNNDGNSENHVELKVYTDSAGTVSSYWNDVTDDQQQYYVLKTLDVDGNPSFKLRLNEADTEGQKFTWQEALVDAENRGGVVANITKRQDEELFIQLVKDAFSLAQGHPVSVWVNATDELIEGQWRRPVQVRGNPYVLETPQGLDFVDGTFTFANAWFDAYQRGGWVATVNSAEEQESIAALADGREIWLGASDSRSESFWHWLEPAYRDVPFWKGNGTGAPVEDAFTNWNNYPDDGYPSEPNNDGGHEHFGEVSADGGWNDLPVTSTRPYIATTRVIRGAGQTSTLGQTMRVASITSSAGNVWLDAPGDVEIDGVIQTGAENTFTWNGTGQVLNDTADPGSASDLQIISASLQLASIGGLGSEAVPLHTQVQSLHAVVPIHSIYVHNEGNLVAGDLAVSKGDLQIVTEGALEIDGPLSVEGGGYVNLVANGSKTVLGMIEGEFTHAEAAANAITRGGRLAVILTEEDQQAVEDAAAGSMVWIGATDEAREGDWQWSIDASTKESFYAAPVQFWSGDANGLSVNNEYQNWNIGEPNNSNDNENHIELYAAGGSAYGTWNDLNGDQLRHYVLETNGELSLSTLTFTFDGALNDAANRNGHVASITSSEDQQAVLAAAHGNNVWINATDEGHEGEWWRPASGYPVNGHYENWAEGQPDNYQGLEHFGGLRVDGTWNDFTAENTLPYVLEYDTSLIIGAPVFTHGGDGNISLIGSHGVRIETEIQYISGSDVHIGGQDNQVNYAQAKTDAALRNGWLAVLTSDQAIQTALTAIDGRTALAGGTDEGHEGDWRWVDSPMLPEDGVTFWLNGEEQNGLPAYWNNSSPSPEPNGGVNENILEIEGDGSWNDLAAGDLRNGYLLQLPSVYTGGYGQIVITAGTAYDNQLRHGSNTADIWMQDGSSVTSEHGNIALLATQDIWLSNVATSWKTDAASRIGDVLIVADYDGIEGTLFDTVGAIYDNLTGDALNVTARHGVFSAEGAWQNSGHGVGASGKPLHTQIHSIAAMTDNGDIAIRNHGDLTVGSVGIQLQGVMSDIDPFTQVVPVQELLQYQSDFYNSKPDLTIPGYFQVGGLAIVKTSGASHETASIDVSAQGSLTAHAAVPILNMTAGHITLKALSDYPLHQLSVTIPVFANGGLQNIHLSGGSEHVPIVVPLSVDSIEWYHHINVESTLLEGGNAEVSISRDENATTLPDTDLRYVFSTVQSDVAAATYADGSTETSYSLELPEDGVQVVFLRVLYPNGQSTDYTSVFTVADVAPTDLAVLTPADPITPGTLQTLTGQFDDLDVNDQHHVTIDWADGTDDAVIDLQNSARSFTGSHTYTAPGRYVATVTVTDIESGKSTSSNTTYFVSGVALQEGTLNIIGTWEYDRIRVNGGRSWTHVVAHMNGLPRQSEWISTSDIQQIMFRPYDEGDRLRTIGPVSFPITQVTVPLSTPSWTTEGNTKTTDEFQPVSWNPVSGATEYQVWYTNVSTGEKPFLLATTTQTTFTPTRALPIGQYNIWVRAQRDSQNSAWGPGLAMRVWSRATLHTPDFQQTSLTPALTWDALSGATSYRIWYDNITTGARQVIDTTVTGTSFTPSQDLGLGKYRVWVAGIAARGMQARWSYPIDFNVGPQTVSPIIPAFTRRPVFEWTSVPETGSYELYIHTRSGVLQPAGISGTSWTPDTDLPSGAFYWWVRGLTDSNIAAPWSERAAGDTDGRTSLITPTGAGYSGTPLFQWQSVQNAATYILHVQRLSDRQVVIRQDSLTTNTHTPATALVSGAYRVWVQAISRTGQPGLWSIPADFTVASVIAPDAAVSPLQHILTVLPTGIPGLLADDDVRTMAASVQSSDGRFTESKAVDSVNKTDTDEASDTETGQTFQTPGMSSEAADRPVTVITEEPEDFTLVDQLMSGLSERKTLPETFLDSSY
ncbi:lectin-like protein [uncultured Gimesia sp.]|uniref:lectin-like protein n=1 Tax=uncultured Gimesia sp. TaxID=1678688 RepID=UPI002629763E|nr:lectin-like protein [uncultured Gimesia sp.]